MVKKSKLHIFGLQYKLIIIFCSYKIYYAWRIKIVMVVMWNNTKTFSISFVGFHLEFICDVFQEWKDWSLSQHSHPQPLHQSLSQRWCSLQHQVGGVQRSNSQSLTEGYSRLFHRLSYRPAGLHRLAGRYYWQLPYTRVDYVPQTENKNLATEPDKKVHYTSVKCYIYKNCLL